ncbi:site-specific DNA-methyltransferase [Halogeometricum borinquense]|uniref:Type II methyltransferase n=1 Tax=Halogeometricum borinquense TaxID=60847 RepID=A0A6C0UR41_9EURY|nr:site-specific DNA-methyltransferase [Halogeometricum borinquense]QIB75408.1 site-specific DNA-methyltransferase [Halogeometricum borinquense]
MTDSAEKDSGDVLKHPEPDEPSTYDIYKADARNIPREDNSVDFVITSPPYWQKRDYGFDDQIGQEESPDEFIEAIIDCMDEWRRVLKPTGSLFLNIGDTYHKRSLRGIPGMLHQAAVEDGWLVRNTILWAKDGGMPEPAKNRLANRYEHIFHFTQNNSYYYDLFGYSNKYGNGSNPGDVWNIGFDRNTGGHLAPFPRELVERALVLGCPPAVCSECGEPYTREMQRTTRLDTSRPQAKRATELYEESDLTEEHIRAVQAVGISDAGKAMEIQDGTGRNADDVQKLADEAKEVLGGYFREFTFPIKETAGWSGCDCDAPTKPGTVMDPFMGSGTTLEVASNMGLSSVGVDLDPPENVQMPITAAKQKQD